MDSLEREILKYEKKEFKFQQKRTLKYGSRAFLVKKGGFFGTDTDVYIYYVDGNASTDSFREFFKDYEKFYQDHKFDSDDKGLFLCSGNCDERVFKNFRKMISNEDVRNTIKLLNLGETIEKEEVEEKQPRIEVKEKIAEREITRTNISTEKVSFPNVVRTIESISFISSKLEEQYENQLYQYLISKGFDVYHEKSRKGARFDLVIGKDEIAVELKLVKGSRTFRDLLGQILTYKDQFNNIIIVLVDKFGNPSVMRQETKRIKAIDPENIAVVVK